MNEPGPTTPSKAETVALHIETLILEGSLRPGEPLLPERELAERLNVSRPTLRTALKALERRGLLTGREGRGLEVSRLGAAAITDPLLRLLAERGEAADDYLEFREIIEGASAAMAASRANAVDLERLRACAARIEQAYAAADPAEEAEADTELHLAIHEASHNLVLLHIMQALSPMLRTDVLQNRQRLFTIPDVREVFRDQHLAIVRAILDRREGDAKAAAEAHLSYVRRTTREIRKAEARLDLSRRRLESGGLGGAKG
ncbi:FCD domain-containing protein [Paracoccus sp. Z118]|uniref:FCD domain-containing protein n=1 Tax=Paracoccus sp. Z118 TaxID=2851017 RepID=UPI001C2BD3B5|nr:FCD domain-containing protein [Paracoccus sp. Z118]MBV0890945.1 FCD domain-containing protein [Paracoccus sp. Z118]